MTVSALLRRALAACGLLVAVSPPLALAAAGNAPAKRTATPVTVFEPDYALAPSFRYANLARDACLAELSTRAIHFTRVDEARGVDAPVRIPDGIGGMRFHIELPAELGRRSPFEVFDCRLVLALDDFSKILRAHGVDDVVIFSGWRPPPKSWPADRQARRHPGALAVDIKRLRVRVEPPEPAATPPADPDASGGEPQGVTEPDASGGEAKSKTEGDGGGEAKGKTEGAEKPSPVPTHRWLDVEQHFHGRIGAQTCGPGAEPPTTVTAETTVLRTIVCEAAAARIFSSMLTPNYNRDHFNHFHFEVTPEVKWRIVR